MHTCIPLYGLKRSWHSHPRHVSNENTPNMHHPQGQKVTTSMVRLKNSHIWKILTSMVNPKDRAENAEEEDEEENKKNITNKIILPHWVVRIDRYWFDKFRGWNSSALVVCLASWIRSRLRRIFLVERIFPLELTWAVTAYPKKLFWTRV